MPGNDLPPEEVGNGLQTRGLKPQAIVSVRKFDGSLLIKNLRKQASSTCFDCTLQLRAWSAHLF